MNSTKRSYMLSEIPDQRLPAAQLKAGGNVLSAINADAEHLLRTLSEFEPGSVSVAIRFVYDPVINGQGKQGRLRIYLTAQSHDEDASQVLSLLLDQGPFKRFYKFQVCDGQVPLAWDSFSAACDIVRRQSIHEPTVTADFNIKALPFYYMIDSFKPDCSNNYMSLDSMLDRLSEPAMVEVCIEPVDIAFESSQFISCISKYQSVNRTWDMDDGFINADYRSNGQDWSMAVKPLRQKEPLIDDLLRRARKFNETLSRRHLKFNIRAVAKTQAMARLLASVVAESAFSDGSYQLFDSVKGDAFFEKIQQDEDQLKVLTVPALEQLLADRETGLYKGLSAFGNVAPVNELHSIFRLPVASPLGSPKCIRKDTDPDIESTGDMIVLGEDEQTIDSEGKESNSIPRGILLSNLPKHCAIFGVPGVGKSIAGINIMRRLCDRNIPFILFEPGKSEYRRLKCLKNSSVKSARKLARELKLFTPGSDISPLRINPLQIPEGISRNEHIENLLSCFKAAMPMEGSMLGLLGEALEKVYENYPNPRNPPRISDVHAALKTVLFSKGYSSEIESNFGALFDVRLGDLTRRGTGTAFQCSHNVPTIDELVNGYSVVELDAMPAEQGCLFTLFMLVLIREYVKTTSWSGDGVRLVIMLEEAHNIVGVNTNAGVSENNADPKAYASEFICRMLAELRSLGVAIIIFDQTPSAVAPQVVKNTCTKIAFRQVCNEDREIIGGSMLFEEVDMQEIARLRPGQAYFYTEGYFGPRRIVTPNLHKDWDIPMPPIGNAILPYIVEDEWFIKTTEKRITLELELFRQGLEKYKNHRKKLLDEAKRIRPRYHEIMKETPASQRCRKFAELRENAKRINRKISISLKVFRQKFYGPFLATEQHSNVTSDGIKTFRDFLIRRYEKVCETSDNYMNILDDLINDCDKKL